MGLRILVSKILWLLAVGCMCAAFEPVFAADRFEGADHVFVIIMENKNYQEIVKGTDAPFFNSLSGGRLSNYWALAHPSLPNYVGLMGAWPPLPVSDDPRIRISGNSYPEEMFRHHLTVGAYMQALPRAGYGGSSYPRLFSRYVLKHDPFLLFSRLRKSPVREAVVPLSRLKGDLVRGQIPNFSLIVPDLCHDMHGAFSCHFHNRHELIRAGDRFLARWVPMIENSRVYRKNHIWIIIVWDESSDQKMNPDRKVGTKNFPGPDPSRLSAGGHVPLLWLDSKKSRSWSSDCFANHYSILETLTRNFGLPPLSPPGERIPLPQSGERCRTVSASE